MHSSACIKDWRVLRDVAEPPKKNANQKALFINRKALSISRKALCCCKWYCVK